MNQQFSLHEFDSLENASFSIKDYSRLKFGSDQIARKFGHELAKKFFEENASILLANKCCIIPSPYNVVENAATIMARHFMDKLNELLVKANGVHVDWSVIHRKVSYINDYGFLSKEKRKGLIDNDDFYLNTEFLEGKLLIFIDDVKITGTHEDKLVEILGKRNIKNDTFFVYFASYLGNDPTVESRLNFASITNLDEYIEMTLREDVNVIIRPMKFLMGQNSVQLVKALDRAPDELIRGLYFGCLNEGYYALPSYQGNFQLVSVIYSERCRA